MLSNHHNHDKRRTDSTSPEKTACRTRGGRLEPIGNLRSVATLALVLALGSSFPAGARSRRPHVSSRSLDTPVSTSPKQSIAPTASTPRSPRGQADALAAGSGGSVVFRRSDGHLERLVTQRDATPVDLSERLDRLSPGAADAWVNQSANGSWLLVSTERFGCASDGPCLVVAPADVRTAEVVRVADVAVRSDGFSAINSTGTTIVYVAGDGHHTRDLWVIERGDVGWSLPRELTAASKYAYNSQPALSPDGSRVVFSCGDVPYEAAGSTLCEIRTDGSGLRELLDPRARGGSADNAVRRGSYAPDGSVVFEAEWSGEQIWRLPSGRVDPIRVTASAVANDNSPCVLPDGRVVSLWLGAKDNSTGIHQLRVAFPDGSGAAVLPFGADIIDIGLGCGKA